MNDLYMTFVQGVAIAQSLYGFLIWGLLHVCEALFYKMKYKGFSNFLTFNDADSISVKLKPRKTIFK